MSTEISAVDSLPGKLLHKRKGVAEKALISLAEVIDARRGEPVAEASVPAQSVERTVFADIGNWKRTFQKILLPPGLPKRFQRRLGEISEAVSVRGVEIAGIDRTVRLNNRLQTAASSLFAGFGRNSQQEIEIVFKLAYVRGAPKETVLIPEIKELN